MQAKHDHEYRETNPLMPLTKEAVAALTADASALSDATAVFSNKFYLAAASQKTEPAAGDAVSAFSTTSAVPALSSLSPGSAAVAASAVSAAEAVQDAAASTQARFTNELTADTDTYPQIATGAKGKADLAKETAIANTDSTTRRISNVPPKLQFSRIDLTGDSLNNGQAATNSVLNSAATANAALNSTQFNLRPVNLDRSALSTESVEESQDYQKKPRSSKFRRLWQAFKAKQNAAFYKAANDAKLLNELNKDEHEQATNQAAISSNIPQLNSNSSLNAAASDSKLLVNSDLVLYKGLSDLSESHLQNLQAEQAKLLTDPKQAAILQALSAVEQTDSDNLTAVTSTPLTDTVSDKNDSNTIANGKHLDLAYLKRESSETWEFSKELTGDIIKRGKDALPKYTPLNFCIRTYQRVISACRRKQTQLLKSCKRAVSNFKHNLTSSEQQTAAHNATLANQPWFVRILRLHLSIKNTLMLLAVACCLLLVLFSCIYLFQFNKEANSAFKNSLSNNVQGISQAGTLTHKIVTLEQLTLDLNYPTFNESYLDYLVKTKIDSLMQPYITRAENDVKSKQLRKKPLLNIDYDSYLLSDRLLSLVFTVNYYAEPDKAQNLTDLSYSSFYYDWTYHIPLQIEDLLGHDTKIKQDIANNFNEIFAYERQADLGLTVDSPSLANLLFTKDNLLLIVDPKDAATSLRKTEIQEKDIIPNGGSRYLYANYIALPYNEASKYFSSKAKLPFNLKYDVWLRYLADNNPNKLFPFKPHNLTADAPYKYLALTFNNLPGADTVDSLLNLLAEYQMQATFFIHGQDAEDSAKVEIIKKIAQHQHEIANLGYSGAALSAYESQMDFIETEVEKSKTLLESVSQTKVNLYRPPLEANFNDYLRLLNYPLIAWNNFSDDQHNSVERVVKFLNSNPEAGDIVLLHADNPTAIKALEQALPLLKNANFRYVKVSDLALIYGNKLSSKHLVYEDLAPLGN